MVPPFLIIVYRSMKKVFISIVGLLFWGSSQQMSAQNWNTTARIKIHKKSQGSKTMIIDGGVRWMGFFNNGLACVKWNKGWFVINDKGEKVFDIPSGYYPKSTDNTGLEENGFVGYGSNRLMVYSKSQKIAIIYDNKGQKIKDFKEVEDCSAFVDGVALIKKYVQEPGKWSKTAVWSHVDINGDVLSKTMPVSEQNYGGYRLFSIKNGLALVWDKKAHLWGYRNDKCQWVIKPSYRNAHQFSNGLAAVQDENKKWGFIDTTGKWIIQPVYSREPSDFAMSYAMVVDKLDRVHFINRNGNIVWSDNPSFNIGKIRPFLNNDYAIWTYSDGNYLIDSSFKKRVKLDIDASGGNSRVTNYNKDYFQWLTSWNGVSRLIDWKGNLLLELSDEYGTFCNGICSRSRGSIYYFNDKGEIIVTFEDTLF